jgi:hypothetical protein
MFAIELSGPKFPNLYTVTYQAKVATSFRVGPAVGRKGRHFYKPGLGETYVNIERIRHVSSSRSTTIEYLQPGRFMMVIGNHIHDLPAPSGACPLDSMDLVGRAGESMP